MKFFSQIPVDKGQIETAIRRLEAKTSAELRVYIERKCPKKCGEISAISRALQVFGELGMHNTAAQNGVLIYISYDEHRCAIVGDKGINDVVSADYWQIQCETMIGFFKQHQYTQGIVSVIDEIALPLSQHFPIQADDKNELDNEVIIND